MDRGGLGWGLWVVARWVVTRVGGDKCPKLGGAKIWHYWGGGVVRSRPW